VNLELKLLKRDKGQFILIKGAIHQEQITIINLFIPNVSVPNFIKHALKDLEGHIDPNTGEFNTLLSTKDRSSRQKKSTKIS
jgi:hypothetical protein